MNKFQKTKFWHYPNHTTNCGLWVSLNCNITHIVKNQKMPFRFTQIPPENNMSCFSWAIHLNFSYFGNFFLQFFHNHFNNHFWLKLSLLNFILPTRSLFQNLKSFRNKRNSNRLTFCAIETKTAENVEHSEIAFPKSSVFDPKNGFRQNWNFLGNQKKWTSFISKKNWWYPHFRRHKNAKNIRY